MRLPRLRLTAYVLVAAAFVAAATAFFWLRPISVAVVEPVENIDVDVYGLGSVEAAQEAKTAADVAAADVVVAERAVDLAEAALQDAGASANLERALLSYYTLTAPYDGVVVKRHAEPGAALNPAQTLFTYVDPATVWVRAFVDEARAGGLQVGQDAEIRLRSLPQRTFSGHVARIDIESDRVSEERRVHIVCDSCPTEFHLGEQAEVIIKKGGLSHVILVAESAIDGYDGRSGRVWTVEHGRLAQRQVALGERTLDGRIAIHDELPPDVWVLAELRSGLRLGRAVRIGSSREDGPTASADGDAS